MMIQPNQSSSSSKVQDKMIEFSVPKKPRSERKRKRTENGGNSLQKCVSQPDLEPDNHKINTSPNSNLLLHKEEIFKNDLMATPRKSSPERDSDSSVDLLLDSQPIVHNVDNIMEIVPRDGETSEPMGKHSSAKEVVLEEKTNTEEHSSPNQTGKKEEILDLQLSLALPTPSPSLSTTTLSGCSGSPRSLGYRHPVCQVPSFQSIVSLDENGSSSTDLESTHFVFAQPWVKRCTTHLYIAENISNHQQLLKTKSHFNMPRSESVAVGNPIRGNLGERNLNSVQEKETIAASLSSQTRKENNSGAPAAPQPSAVVTNILHGTSFGSSFGSPLVPKQLGAAPQAGSTKSASTAGNGASTSAPGVLVKPSASRLAILPNGGYHFPIPSHNGAHPPAYRGGEHAQSMGGVVYPQKRPPNSQPLAAQMGHSNTNTSSGSSSLYKQQKGGSNGSSGSRNSRGFPVAGNQSQRQQSQMAQIEHKHWQGRSRKRAKNAPGSKVSHVQNVISAEDFQSAMLLPQNFSSVPGAAAAAGASVLGAASIRSSGSRQQQQQQSQLPPSSKVGGIDEGIPSNSFTMTSSRINLSSSTPQVLQTHPESTTRHQRRRKKTCNNTSVGESPDPQLSANFISKAMNDYDFRLNQTLYG